MKQLLQSKSRLGFVAFSSLLLMTWIVFSNFLIPAKRHSLMGPLSFYSFLGIGIQLGRILIISLALGLLTAVIFRKKYGIGKVFAFFILFSLPVSIVWAVPAFVNGYPYIMGTNEKTEVILQITIGDGKTAPEMAEVEKFRKQTTSRLASHQVWILEWSQPAPDRVKMILMGEDVPSVVRSVFSSGTLGFYETYEFNQGFAKLEEADEKCIELLKSGILKPTPFMLEYGDPDSAYLTLLPESPVTQDTIADFIHPQKREEQMEERRRQFQLAHPVIGLMTIMPVEQITPQHPLMGYVQEKDTALFLSYLRHPSVQAIMGPDARFMLSAFPSEVFTEEAGNYYDVIAVKPTRGGQRITSQDVTSAKQDFIDGGQAAVGIEFSEKGAMAWEILTRNNQGHCIAIVLDGVVFSYPNVQSVIKGGHAQITGNFSVAKARDLAALINSGEMTIKVNVLSVRSMNGRQ